MENPVLGREFLTALRTRKAVAFGVAFIWMLAALVVLMWPAEGTVSLAAQSSRELFILLAMGQLVLVLLVAPSFTAVCITTEKERETYQLLYHTLLYPHQIVFGKLAAGMGFVFILLLCALPMMGACHILGGVSSADIVGVYVVLLASAILFGLVGMLCSCYFRSSYTSMIICYVILLVLSGLTWVPSVILGKWAQNVFLIHAVRGVSPFAAMISIINPDFFAAEHGGTAAGWHAWADTSQPFLLVAVCGSVLVLLQGLRLVARPPQPKRRADNTIIDERLELMKRKAKFPFYLFDPKRRKKMIGGFWNVIAIKEMRTKAFARVQWLIRAMYGAVVVSFILAFIPLTQIGYVDIPTIILVCLCLPLGMIVLVSPVLTSSAISEERESGVFEALRMTRLSALTIVIGKLQVAWFFVVLLVSSTFPAFFILAFIGSPAGEMEKMAKAVKIFRTTFDFGATLEAVSQLKLDIFIGMLQSFGVALTTIFFVTVIGLVCSAFLRRSSAATAVAYGGVFALSFGTLVPYFMADSLPLSVVEFFVTMNPFAAAGKAASGQVFTELSADLWINHMKIVGGLGVLLLGVAAVRVWLLMRPEA